MCGIKGYRKYRKSCRSRDPRGRQAGNRAGMTTVLAPKFKVCALSIFFSRIQIAYIRGVNFRSVANVAV